MKIFLAKINGPRIEIFILAKKIRAV